MKKIDKILLEHQRTELFIKDEENESEQRRIFGKLEDSIEAVWNGQKLNKYGARPQPRTEDVLSDEAEQPFLKFNYRDLSVTPRSYIGVVQTKDVRLTIVPKIFEKDKADLNSLSEVARRRFINDASRDLLYFLGYADDLRLQETKLASFQENRNIDFFEVFIYLFASKTLEVYSRFLYHAYIDVSENIGYIRGKINFNEHTKENLIRNRLDRIHCTYSIFQEDNLFNRIVKYVARVLLTTTSVDENRALLRQLSSLLCDISDQECTIDDCRKIVLNNSYQILIPILNYCKLFLANSLIKFNKSKLDIYCFLMDMNELFEKFIAGFLRQHFHGINGMSIYSQKSDMYLTDEHKFQMKHDILVENNKLPFLIIDTKYKSTDFDNPDGKGGISQGDLYQMLSYCVRRKCNQAVLLYPKYSDDNKSDLITFHIRNAFSENAIEVRGAKISLSNLPLEKRPKDDYFKDTLANILSPKGRTATMK